MLETLEKMNNSSQNVNFWEYSKQFKKTQVAQSLYLSAQIRFEFFCVYRVFNR